MPLRRISAICRVREVSESNREPGGESGQRQDFKGSKYGKHRLYLQILGRSMYNNLSFRPINDTFGHQLKANGYMSCDSLLSYFYMVSIFIG